MFKIGFICFVVSTVGYIIVRGIAYLNCVSNCQALANSSPIFKDAYGTCVPGCQFFNIEHFIIILVFMYLPACILTGVLINYLDVARKQ